MMMAYDKTFTFQLILFLTPVVAPDALSNSTHDCDLEFGTESCNNASSSASSSSEDQDDRAKENPLPLPSQLTTSVPLAVGTGLPGFDINESLLATQDKVADDAALKCHHKKELLSNYSQASSSFIECAVCHAKPVLFCGLCVQQFYHAECAWNRIKNDEDCNEDILVSDKLQIVSQTRTFLFQLWQDGYCENCYEESENFRPKNSTLYFLEKYNETIQCFLNNGGGSDVPKPVQTNMTLCSNCSNEYKELNRVYDRIGDDKLCMDIIDLMNRTRMEWRASGCQHLDHDFPIVIALSVFFCILPLFFYTIAKLHGSKKQQKLVEKAHGRDRAGMSASARLYAGTTTSLR